MSNMVRVRVEAKNFNPHASYDERDREFRYMFSRFKKQCSEYGVMHSLKQHESYESMSRKKRRKKRESELIQLKTRLRENFSEQGRRHE
jgi:ribosomal protein S21